MNEPDSSKTSGPPRTAGMLEIRAEGSHLNRQLLLPAERFIYSETISGVLLVFCAIVALDLHHWINDGLMAIFFSLWRWRSNANWSLATSPTLARQPCQWSLRWACAFTIADFPAHFCDRRRRRLDPGDRDAWNVAPDALAGVSLDPGLCITGYYFLGGDAQIGRTRHHRWRDSRCHFNAGVAPSTKFIRQAFTSAVNLGVMLGSVVGKVSGVTGFAWLAVRLGWAELPCGVTWRHITGAGLIGGVGFTVSLFITGLAFSEAQLIEEAKAGVLAASIIGAFGGYLFLLLVSRGSKPGEVKESGV